MSEVIECEECCTSCHPDDSERNYEQWRENQLCRQCNANAFSVEQAEYYGLINIGY